MVSEQLRAEIKERHEDGESSAVIASDYGLPVGVVSKITRGAKKAADRTKESDAKNAELNEVISNFRANGCSIPRCPKCKEILTEIKEKASDGTLHFSCAKCGYTDWQDKLCNNDCCARGLKILAEQKGYDVTEDLEAEDENVCPNCKGDVVLVKPNVAYCERCNEYFKYEE